MQAAFSYAELEKLLGRHGFRIDDWLAPCNIQTRIIESAGANLKAFEHVNYCLCPACYNCVGSEKLTASERYRCPNLSYNEDVLRERSIA